MKFAAFDLEIYKPFPEEQDEVTIKSARPLGISCLAIQFGELNETSRYYELEHIYSLGAAEDGLSPLTKTEALCVAQMLDGFQKEGGVIVTWNGASFDFDILGEECGDSQLCRRLALNHVDMMVHFATKMGYRLGIDAVHKGLGFKGKLEGMHGDLAPHVWRGNNDFLLSKGRDDLAHLSLEQKQFLCLEYVKQDARMTAEVFAETIRQGGFSWISRKGNQIYFQMPSRKWLTVQECSNQHIARPIWITEALTWPGLVGWLANER